MTWCRRLPWLSGRHEERGAMNWGQELRRKADFLRRQNGFAEDLGSEMEFHLATRTEELMAAGMAARDARAQAQREFGPKLRVQEDSRAAWQGPWFGDL